MSDKFFFVMNNYFETLEAALNEAARRAYAEGAGFDSIELVDAFSGGVSYGETKRAAIPLTKWKGKIVSAINRALTVVIYRMESGKYELTSYLN